MVEGSDPTRIVVLGGFVLAFLLGLVWNRSNFCTMGAVADILTMGSWQRMRMWLLAIAVAILGANALQLAGLVDLTKSVYLRPNLYWLSHLVGGFAFGVGMTLASGCGAKTLVRIGGGSYRSLVVLVFLALSAYMTMRGLFAAWRIRWLDPLRVDLSAIGFEFQDLPTILGALTGLDRRTMVLVVPLVVGGALLAFVLSDPRFRAKPSHVFGGAAIGALVTAGWYLSGHIGFGEHPETMEMVFFGTDSKAPESFAFVGPAARTLELLMLWTDKSLHVSFGIACVIGVILGSAAGALSTRSFHWEGFASTQDTRNHIVGAVLMGSGGVCALGCTMGQGMTGVSTLSVGAIITFAAIVAGSAATLKVQIRRLEREG